MLVPLKANQGSVIAALVIEYFSQQEPAEFIDQKMLIEECLSFSVPLIARLFRIYQIPGIGTVERLFNLVRTQPLAVLIKSLILMVLLVSLSWLLFFWKFPFDLHSQGRIQPMNERNIFAPENGQVLKLPVTEGVDVVQASLVAEMESREIEEKLVQIEGELAEIRQRLQDLELTNTDNDGVDSQFASAKLAAEIEVLKIRQVTAQENYDQFLDRKNSLRIMSPIDGQVVTPRLRQRLAERPLNRGDLLMTIADLNGPWELELLIPDRKIDYLKQRLEDGGHVTFDFKIVSDPEKEFQGVLREIDYRVEPSSSSEVTFVTIYVDIDEQELAGLLRIGTRVYGNFGCGKRSLFFLLTHELRDSLREWLLF